MSPKEDKCTSDRQVEDHAPEPESDREDLEVKNPSGSMAYNYLYRDDYGYLDD